MNEQISALIDDEVAVNDAAHLIAAVQSSQQAAEAWDQYHLIGDALRGAKVFHPDFKQNLMQKIDGEATVLSPNTAWAHRSDELKQQAGGKARIATGWSVAVSFAAVMVVGWMAMNQTTPSGDELAPVEMAQSIPAEYLMAHQASTPSASAYYIQSVSYSE